MRIFFIFYGRGFIMLLEFSCKNHRSIRNEIVFSALATSDSEHSETLIDFDEKRFLRIAEIYGANGSGKTSLLNAISQMQAIVINSYNHQPGDNIIRFPHKLSMTELTEFICIFERKGVKYSYQFSYDETGIQSEGLFFWPNGRVTNIFERKVDSFDYGPKYLKYKEITQRKLKNNRLLLSVAANDTDIPEITEAFLFFKEDIVIYPGVPNNWLEYTAKKLQNDEKTRQEFIKIMHDAGSDLCDLITKFETRLPQEKEVNGIPEPLKKIFLSKPLNYIDIQIAYKDFSLNLNEESSGIQKLFSFICPLIHILDTNKVFLCDEIETSLHPSVVNYFINKFQKNNSSKSQIIFTTHDTDLLDLNLVRRDEIWFTEMNPKNRETSLYSLAEIRNVRKDENVRKGYISGKYGAIPMPNTDIQNLCKEK